MRFQPRQGKYLAAAGENLISILDVETQAMHSSLQVIFLDLPFFMSCSGLSKTFVYTHYIWWFVRFVAVIVQVLLHG